MAFDLASISSEAINEPPIIILTGVEKCGKSTFASQFPNPIFLPIIQERGVTKINVSKFPTIETYNDLIEALGTLCEEEHDFKTVVIDSASTLEPLIWDVVCKKFGAVSIETVLKGFGKGYKEALVYWSEVMNALTWLRDNKGMTPILITHVKIRQASDPLSDPYDAYEIDLQKDAVLKLARWADCILFANKKTIIKTEESSYGKEQKRAIGVDEFKLYTQKRPAHPGGCRYEYGKLPYELNLDYTKFSEAVEKVRNN